MTLDVLARLTDGAANDLVTWLRAQPGDAASIWASCPRGDWLLAIAVRAGIPRDTRLRAAAACAREALSSFHEPPPAALAAIDAAERRARDELDDAACELAATAAEHAADHAHTPGDAAALHAAACAARSAADPHAAVSVAVLAAEVAVHEAGDCAMTAALSYAQRRCAEHVRHFISWSDIGDMLSPPTTGDR